ncbi:MAG: hypothetical protein EA411_09230 [Saprospirales bacterium]|nr:MAG: hypothetical protein EA411_09230 [Saprospirales bacterium]
MVRTIRFKLGKNGAAGILLPLIGVVLLFLVSCMPEVEEEDTYLPYDLRIGLFRNIYDLGDRAETDSLLYYLEHEEPYARYASLLRLASIKDSSQPVISAIGERLHDPHMEVASMAAWTMGQTGIQAAVSPLINAFRAHDTLGRYNQLNSRILEAVGKCGDENALEMLATITTYRPSDTLLLLGQSSGLFNFAVRGITLREGTDVMINYATRNQFPDNVRLVAANYLARAPGIDLTDYAYILTRQLEQESDPEIRMALALAVSKVRSARAREILARVAQNDPDYRVRANAVRSLDALGVGDLTGIGMRLVEDDHPQVSQLAGQMLVRHISTDMATDIHNMADNDALPLRTRALLYGAGLKNMPFYFTVTAGSINESLRRMYQQEEDPFVKSVWAEAMSYDPVNHRQLIEWFDSEEDPFLRVSILRHLENTLRVSREKPAVNFNRATVASRIANTYRSALESAEIGPVSQVCKLLLQNNEFFSNHFRDPDLFINLLEELEESREVGTYNTVVRTYNALFEEQKELKKPGWNNPINWELYDRLPDTARVLIRLSKGYVRLELPKEEHPGTVVNFIEHVLEGYYDGKHIHRVVPNFVIQGGCPVGDGFGSLDHSIRSELPPVHFDGAGYLGMASAGPHTESVQWFITHSPAMHLDGNYTRFGRVYEGMEAVHLADVGTTIERIELLNE